MEDQRFAEYLRQNHLGENSAATSRELEIAFSIRGKEVRDTVNRLRRKGVPIASSASGYFYAATEQEVRATIAHMTHRRLKDVVIENKDFEKLIPLSYKDYIVIYNQSSY